MDLLNSSNIFSSDNVLTKRSAYSPNSDEEQSPAANGRAKLETLFEILKLKTKDPVKIKEAIVILKGRKLFTFPEIICESEVCAVS